MKLLVGILGAFLLLSLVSASHADYKASSSESHVTKKSSSWSSDKQKYHFSSTETTSKKTASSKGKTTTTSKRTFSFSETSTNTYTAYQQGSACNGPYHPSRFARSDPDHEHYYDNYYYKPCPQHDGSYSWRY